jgi:hypothetical protein
VGGIVRLWGVRQQVRSPPPYARDVEHGAALALAVADDDRSALVPADDLDNRHASDTIAQSVCLAIVRGRLAIGRKDWSKALEILQAATPYESGSRSSSTTRESWVTTPLALWPGSTWHVPMPGSTTLPRPRRTIRGSWRVEECERMCLSGIRLRGIPEVEVRRGHESESSRSPRRHPSWPSCVPQAQSRRFQSFERTGASASWIDYRVLSAGRQSRRQRSGASLLGSSQRSLLTRT